MTDKAPRRGLSAPLAAQVVALLIAVVAIGQILTLAIAMLVPPPRPSMVLLSEIATALNGQTGRAIDGRRLERSLSTEPPPPGHGRPGQDAQVRTELAAQLGAPEARVRFGTSPDGPPFWVQPFEARRARRYADHPPPPDHRPRPDGAQSAGSPDGPAPGPPPEGEPFQGPPPPEFQAHGQSAQGGDSVQGEPASRPADWRGWRGGWDGRRLVFGGFTAALQQPSGQWVIVKPLPEPFPSTWQARVGLWFLACLAVLGPVGYIFARRLAAPIGAFAEAADRLGRDPNAAPLALSGPAEIGTAARAFNTMQTRVQRYIKDRTSMIAAISHDLRTPLARVRFKMEQADAPLRASVGSDLDEMEAMITAVLGFLRDAAETRTRSDVDLLSVLETVVDDAIDAGGRADLAESDPVVVQADDLALKRMFANLVENAIKYAGGATVGLRAEDGAAVVEIADDGPGLPEDELERVFEPFYRAEPSRNRETGGMGLGLAVARSIARAHGGEVSLRSGPTGGLIAVVRLPLAHPGAPGRLGAVAAAS